MTLIFDNSFNWKKIDNYYIGNDYIDNDYDSVDKCLFNASSVKENWKSWL